MNATIQHGDWGGPQVSAREDSSGAGVRSAGQRPTGDATPVPETSGPPVPGRAVRRNAGRAWRAAARLADRTAWTAPRDAHEVTLRALAAERLRTGRLLARIRLAGLPAAFVPHWVPPKCLAEGPHHQSSMQPLAIYWVVAPSLCLAGLRSERMV